MSRDPLPEPWRTPLERRGIHSKRGLATKAGISPQTAKRLIDGEGRPSHETVAAVADAVFDGDRNKVWELAGVDRRDYGDWQLPPEASQLDPDQRAAVLAVVRAMLPQEQRGRGDGDDRDAAPIGNVVARPVDLPNTQRLFISGAAGSGKTATFVQALLASAGWDPSRAVTELGERYLREEIDDELFMLTSAELRTLKQHPERAAAARSGRSQGRALRAEQDRAGQENQDPGRRRSAMSDRRTRNQEERA